MLRYFKNYIFGFYGRYREAIIRNAYAPGVIDED